VAYFKMRPENDPVVKMISTLSTSKEAADLFYQTGLDFTRLVKYCEDQEADLNIERILESIRELTKREQEVELGGLVSPRRRRFLNTSPRTHAWRRREYGAHYMG
jgi:hypothetical protein